MREYVYCQQDLTPIVTLAEERHPCEYPARYVVPRVSCPHGLPLLRRSMTTDSNAAHSGRTKENIDKATFLG
jgi:hypothetical protein